MKGRTIFIVSVVSIIVIAGIFTLSQTGYALKSMVNLAGDTVDSQEAQRQVKEGIAVANLQAIQSAGIDAVDKEILNGVAGVLYRLRADGELDGFIAGLGTEDLRKVARQVVARLPMTGGAAAAKDFAFDTKERMAEMDHYIQDANVKVTLNGQVVDRDLASALLAKGWLDLEDFTFDSESRTADFALANVYFAKGDYVQKQPEDFQPKAVNAITNEKAYVDIVARDKSQETEIGKIPTVAQLLKDYDEDIGIYLAGNPQDVEALLGANDFINLREIGVEKLVANKDVIKSLMAAK